MMRGLASTWRPRWRLFSALGIAAALTGCSEQAPKSESDISEKKSTEERVNEILQSIIDGVQLIESSDRLTKITGEVDESSQPPHYLVLYEGCLEGFVSGTLCVRDGTHVVEIVAPGTHIIRSVEQRYVFESFGSVPEYTLSGTLDSFAEVSVDTVAKTTEVAGLAYGTLAVSGALSGSVEADLDIGGGRNYTESTATPIVVEGQLRHGGTAYPVAGGFHRE
jgi:hypothetical protein